MRVWSSISARCGQWRMSSRWLYVYLRANGSIGRSRSYRNARTGVEYQYVPEGFAALPDERIRASFARIKRIQGLLDEMTVARGLAVKPSIG